MKKEKMRALFIHCLVIPLLFGSSWVHGQSLGDALLRHLEQPFAKLSDQLSETTYAELAAAAQPLLQDSSFRQEEALLPVLARKALHGDLTDQQSFLHWAFTERPQQSQDFAYTLLKQSKKFPKPAFTPPTQFQLISYLQLDPMYLNEWILLAGLATQDENVIRQLLQQKPTKT